MSLGTGCVEAVTGLSGKDLAVAQRGKRRIVAGAGRKGLSLGLVVDGNGGLGGPVVWEDAGGYGLSLGAGMAGLRRRAMERRPGRDWLAAAGMDWVVARYGLPRAGWACRSGREASGW